MSDWKEYKLGEICEVTSSKRIFYSEYVSSGVPFYRSKEIIDLYNKRDISTELFISDEKYYNIKNKFGVPKPDDILLTSVGSLGIPYKVKLNDKFYFKDGNITWFRNFDKKLVNPDYLIYWLGSRIGIQRLDEITIGSTQAALTISGLKTISLTLPSLEEQRTIAGVLGTLDDKIDLLNRQNQTLESMAEALFRHYFIENPKEEWKDGMLDDILSVKGGTTPSTANPDFWNGTICWSSPRDVTTLNGIYMFDTERKITEKGLSVINSGLLPKGTLLMSSRAPVGVLAFAEVELAINQGYIAILDNKGYSKEFIYLWLKTNMDSVHSFSNGSTFMEISKSAFKSLPLTIPPINLANLFQLEIKPLFDKIKYNQTQISTLSKLRNILLPRLMSGEVYTKITE